MYGENKRFMGIWKRIPEITNLLEYHIIAKAIDDAMEDRKINEKEEEALTEALRAIAEARRIK